MAHSSCLALECSDVDNNQAIATQRTIVVELRREGNRLSISMVAWIGWEYSVYVRPSFKFPGPCCSTARRSFFF